MKRRALNIRPRIIYLSSCVPSASHFFITRMYGWGMFAEVVCVGQANVLITSKMALVARVALIPWYKHSSTRSSM